MGLSWQTAEQKEFIDEFIPSFIKHSADGTAKDEFWPDFLGKWFKAWPVPEPSPDLVQNPGEAQNKMQEECRKRASVSTVYSWRK